MLYSNELPKDIVCPIPWTHIMVGMFGEYRICNAQHTSDWAIFDKSGRICNVWSHSPQEALDSINHTALRALLGNNKSLPMQCTKCAQMEARGLESLREKHLEMYNGVYGITTMDIRLGNTCDARCVMCHPINSNAWYDDWMRIGHKPKIKANKSLEADLILGPNGSWTDNNAGLRWYDEPSSWKNLLVCIDKVDFIMFSGGEPMLVNAHWDFLQKLIEHGHSRRIRLAYKTNLNTITLDFFSIWKHFKSVHLIASIDGIEEKYEYIRYPLSWPKFGKNLKTCLDQGVQISLGLTASAVSIGEMGDVFDWADQTFPNLLYNTTMNEVRAPAQLKLTTLPISYRHELLSKYASTRHTFFNQAISTIQESLTVYAGHHELTRYLDKLDLIRNTDWRTMLPGLANLLD